MENLTAPFLEYRNLPKLFNLLVTAKLLVLGLSSFAEEDAFEQVQFTEIFQSYIFKVSNRNTRVWCEICSSLTIKTPEQHWRRTYFKPCSSVSIANFEQVNAGKVGSVIFEL